MERSVAALLGASATGAFGILDRYSERKRSRATLVAEVAAHAKFLTQLVREQDYLDYAAKVADAAKEADWDGGLLQVLPQGDYLSGISRACERAGELSPAVAAQLVEFAQRGTLFLDSTNPHSKYLEHSTLEDRRSHAAATLANIERLLLLGDELSQLK